MNNSRYNALAEKDISYMMDEKNLETFGALKRSHRLLARTFSRNYSRYNNLSMIDLYYRIVSRVYLND